MNTDVECGQVLHTCLAISQLADRNLLTTAMNFMKKVIMSLLTGSANSEFQNCSLEYALCVHSRNLGFSNFEVIMNFQIALWNMLCMHVHSRNL